MKDLYKSIKQIQLKIYCKGKNNIKIIIKKNIYNQNNKIVNFQHI